MGSVAFAHRVVGLSQKRPPRLTGYTIGIDRLFGVGRVLSGAPTMDDFTLLSFYGGLFLGAVTAAIAVWIVIRK